MKKVLMAILAILTIATGIAQARRRGGGRRGGGIRRGGGRIGRAWRGGGGRRFRHGGWRGGFRWRRRRRRPYFYLGTPWYYPYSYDSGYFYTPDSYSEPSELSQLKARISQLESTIQNALKQGNAQQVQKLQTEMSTISRRVNQIEGRPESYTAVVA